MNYPIDERLLVALADVSPTCGVAMGFDRLVIWSPVPTAFAMSWRSRTRSLTSGGGYLFHTNREH